MRKFLFGLMLVALLALVAVRFAEPVGDGDLFWQMAYGRYMLEHHTLIPDHTIYSWTPTTNSTIYCSWVAEIIFYGLYSIAGLPLLFAFRYACVLFSVWLLFDYLRKLQSHEPRLNLSGRTEVFLYAAVMVLGCYVGTILKPEIFSLVCFHLLAWGYFSMKLEARYQAVPARRWLWFFPLLMLFWVNSHGVFMFGLVALLALCLGDWLNKLVAPGLALPAAYLRRFSVATLLSVAACFVTPYGYRYPLQLARELLGMVSGSQSVNDQAAYASLAAHQSIFAMPAFHFVPIMVFMALSLLWFWGLLARLGGPGKRVDLAVVAVNLALGALFTWYVRTTYYWPPFFAYSALYCLYLVSQISDRGLAVLRPRLAPAALTALVFFGVCAGSMTQAVLLPYSNSWCGFGITYWNPVAEAEWLERFAPQSKIYNDYDGGGYLLWRLYPKTRVMIDPRSFPYRDWYRQYNLFEGGEIFHELLDQFDPAEVAIISTKNQNLWRSFARSGEWVVAWVGPSSAIFTRPGSKFPSGAAEFMPDRFRSVKNFYKLSDVFTMCMELNLYDTGFAALRAMQDNFHGPEDVKMIKAFTRYKDALNAELAEINQKKAMLLYEECRREGLFYSDEKLMQLYKIELEKLQMGSKDGSHVQAIRDLAVRMSAVARGDAPPLPTKGPIGPPTDSPTP